MPALRAGAQRLKPLAESLRSFPHLSLFATPSPIRPLSAQVGGSSAETGLRKRRTGKKVDWRGELPGEGRKGHLATVAGSGAPQRARWPKD